MLESSRLIAFAATTDPGRTRRFYQDVLGLRFVADEPWALVFDAAGTMLRIQKVQELAPPPYTLLGWNVEDVSSTVRTLVDRGVEFLRYDFLEQDELGIWTTPDRAAIAWFKDPDGHTLSLTQLPAGKPGGAA